MYQQLSESQGDKNYSIYYNKFIMTIFLSLCTIFFCTKITTITIIMILLKNLGRNCKLPLSCNKFQPLYSPIFTYSRKSCIKGSSIPSLMQRNKFSFGLIDTIPKQLLQQPYFVTKLMGQIINSIFQKCPQIGITILDQQSQKSKIVYQAHGIADYYTFIKRYFYQDIQKDSQYKLLKGQCNLLNSLEQILQKAHSMPGLYMIGSKNERDFMDKNDGTGIYSLYVRYDKEQKIFDIITFGVSLDRDSIDENVRQMTGFLSLLLLDVPSSSKNQQLLEYVKQKKGDYITFRNWPIVQEDDQNNYRIHHVILCSKRYCQPTKIIADNLLKVSYCQFKNFQFFSNPNTTYTYQELRKFIKQNGM